MVYKKTQGRQVFIRPNGMPDLSGFSALGDSLNKLSDVTKAIGDDQVKQEFNDVSKLVMDFILTKLNPYMYIIITIIVVMLFINIVNIVLIIILYRKQNKYFSDILLYN